MNRAILMAGLVLSIAVLATSVIVPYAMAKPEKDDATGIKVHCQVKGENANCKLIDRSSGIKSFFIAYPENDPPNLVDNGPLDCSKTLTPGISYPMDQVQGQWNIAIQTCDDRTSDFFLTLEGRTFTLDRID